MDSLDIRLLRGMFRENLFSLAGVDPRQPAQGLARYASASRLTVRRRLARWREEGFWKGLVAFPNPDVLGTSLQMQSIVLDPGRTQTQCESAMIDLLQPAFLFQAEGFYNPVLLAAPREISDERQRKFGEVGGCRATSPPLDIPFMSSSVAFTLRDWEILRALRRHSTLDWPAVARDVGLTVRGLQRRVSRLIEGQALFFYPELDFRRSPGTTAWVGLLFGHGADVERLQAEVVRRLPDLFRVEPVFPFELMIPSSGRPSIGGRFPFFLPVPSASSGDQLRRDFLELPGVVDVIVGFPTQNTAVPRPFDVAIDAAIDRAERERASVRIG